jgi:predicted transcriptional regulator
MRQRKLDPLLLRVMQAIHQTAEKPANGFRTIDEWAAKWKVQRSSARMMLLKGVKLGLVEKRTYLRVIRKDAKPYPTAHFGEKTRPRKT